MNVFVPFRTHPPRARSRRGLGQSPRADELASRKFRHIFLLLRLVARQKNMVRAERRVRGDDNPDRAIHARKFFNRADVLHVAHAGSAIFRGKDRAHQPEFAQLLDCGQRKLRRFIPLHHLGRDFARGKFTYVFLEVQLLFIQLKIQVASACALSNRLDLSAANARKQSPQPKGEICATVQGRAVEICWMPRVGFARNA